MPRARGYEPEYCSSEQDAQLDGIVEWVTRTGKDGVAIFDLDGCLFDTRTRQIHIYREYACKYGEDALYKVKPHHIKDWNLDHALANAGVDAETIARLSESVRDYWMARFFTDECVQYDHAMPGGPALVRACHATGAGIVYLTGRDVSMEAGTKVALHNFGFPLDDGQAQLVVKPDFKTDDTEFKKSAVARCRGEREAVLFLDNEPANVNLFHAEYPDAMVVFVETDHSTRPDEPHPDLPWLRSFLRSA